VQSTKLAAGKCFELHLGGQGNARLSAKRRTRPIGFKQSMLAPLVDKVAFAQAINDAWAFVALTTLVGLIIVPLARRTARSERTVLSE
jgi:hypothetical protein